RLAHLGLSCPRAGSRHDVGHQPLISGAILACNHYRAAHSRMRAQGHFYLAEFDAMTPDLDLMIHTSEELERSVGSEPCDISGAIQQSTRSVPERIRQETLRRESGSLEVAVRHSIATDVEFSGDAQGSGRQRGIQHVHLRVRDWPAYRNRPIDAVQAMGRGPDGGLRRA